MYNACMKIRENEVKRGTESEKCTKNVIIKLIVSSALSATKTLRMRFYSITEKINIIFLKRDLLPLLIHEGGRSRVVN